MGYGLCSRCGSWMLEHLSTHSHCWECGYFPEQDIALLGWRRHEFFKERLPKIKSGITGLTFTNQLHNSSSMLLRGVS